VELGVNNMASINKLLLAAKTLRESLSHFVAFLHADLSVRFRLLALSCPISFQCFACFPSTSCTWYVLCCVVVQKRKKEKKRERREREKRKREREKSETSA